MGGFLAVVALVLLANDMRNKKKLAAADREFEAVTKHLNRHFPMAVGRLRKAYDVRKRNEHNGVF